MALENYSHSSYPDSINSSPRSREIDCENPSWDELPTNYKVKFMCSYGGKIHPRPHDNQLTYIGGDTKILAVDRNIKFSGLISRLSSHCEAEVCFKYQLPGEDLDSLISVTNDEDLEHMMIEYDRLYRTSAKPARLRLFLFPLNPPAPANLDSISPKSERQWFLDALNSFQIHNQDTSSPPAAAVSASTDFLFGLDKGSHSAVQLQDQTPVPTVPDMLPKKIPTLPETGSENQHIIVDPAVPSLEIQRQIQEFQRLQIANHEQAISQRRAEETNPRSYSDQDFYGQRVPGKLAVPMAIPTTYWPEQQIPAGSYSVTPGTGAEPPLYLLTTSAGMYHTPCMRPVTGQVGQSYYGLQRMLPPELCREQSVQHSKIGTYNEGISIGLRPPTSGINVAETGYAQISYDSAGRPVYYTAPVGIVGAQPQPFQAVSAAAAVSVVDTSRQGVGAFGQESKVGAKSSQASG